ncbi:MAG: LuxR C-terminal-related transcriptional regulator [Acidimicrobiales bacterium]
MIMVSAPPGSGKTVLLRSWIEDAGLAGHAAFVSARRGEREPQRFWPLVLDALAVTTPGAELVRVVTAAPDLDGWAIVEQLLEDLGALGEALWLVIDDVHELRSSEALAQLELLVMRAPPALRVVLATRHDVRLGLHRLRLEGEVVEIRAADLRFNVTEAAALLRGARVELDEQAVEELHRRTEGWAAGLRLAALSLSGHPDPARFAAEFSGSERTVAEYLLAEVLERQRDEVRRLLLRTSVLERVNGELADLLTGDRGSERVLQDLEEQNAFVVSTDPARTWFRFHQLFADLLALELRRAAPGEIRGLHLAAAGWLAEHGHPVEAVRHAQAAQHFDLATHLLAGHWPALRLDGQVADIHELLAGFPADRLMSDPALAVVAAADEMAQGSLEAAERYLGVAERGSASVTEAQREQLELALGRVRLVLARQRGNLPAVTKEVSRLGAMAEAVEITQSKLREDLSALALISLGSTEFWAGAPDDAARHLELAVERAHRNDRPYLEMVGLAHWAAAVLPRSYGLAAQCARQAIELAERHGWTGDPAFGIACLALGTVLTGQGRPEEAEAWVERAERRLRAESDPAAVLAARYVRGILEQALGHDILAVASFQAVQPLTGRLASPQYLAPRARAQEVHSLVRLGQVERAGEVLAGLDEDERSHSDIRIAAAALRLVQGEPAAALSELGPVLDGSSPVVLGFRLVTAYALAAAARDAIGDPAEADSAVEIALDLAEPDGALSPFLWAPSADLLERHARSRGTHASLVADIQSLLAGNARASTLAEASPLVEPLSNAELRVLRYLPTNLSVPEIAREMYVSQNTVKTHVQNLYAKLGTHRRSEAVMRARDLGLLAPSGIRTKAVAPGP